MTAKLAKVSIRVLFLIATGIVLGFSAHHYSNVVTNHDVSWLLLGARRLLGGGHFDTDVYEMNAPGAVFIYLPAAWLWELTGLPAQTVVTAYVILLTALTAGLTGHLLSRTLGPLHYPLRAAYVLYVMAVLLALPRADFGQREHLIAILMLPYCLTGASIGTEQAPNSLLRGVAAALAAIAISVKPIYLPFPLLLMGLHVCRQGWRPMIAGVEIKVFVILGSSYLVCIALMFPEWLEIARRAAQLYAAYNQADYFSPTSLHDLRWVAASLLLGGGLNYGMIRRRHPTLFRWINSLLLFSALTALLFIGQKKAWAYHLLPAQLMLGIAGGAVLLALALCYSRRNLETLATFSLAVIAIAAGGLLMARSHHTSKQAFLQTPLVQTVRQLTGKPVVSVYATSLTPAFPLVTELDLEWGSRFPHLWTLAGLRYRERLNQQSATVELQALESEIVGMIVDDLARYQPSVVVVDEAQTKQAVDDHFDILRRLSQHAAFRDQWSAYAKVSTVGSYAIYQRHPESR